MIDFIMRTAEQGIRLSKKNKTSKVYTGDCAITYDPFQRTLISIYPETSPLKNRSPITNVNKTETFNG
jgi:hypothetical protein